MTSLTYKVIFENNVGEDARMQYGCVSIYWNADKPGAVLQGETGNLLLTGSSSSVSGEFLIMYAGQSFTIDVDYTLGSWPTFQATRHSDGSSPAYYITGIVNPPSVNGSQATVVFEVVDPKKPSSAK